VTPRDKKRNFSVVISLGLYQELKKTALRKGWTDEETLAWAMAYGVGDGNNIEEMEKELAEFMSRKSELDLELKSIALDYGRLSSRNAALRYEYFETFSENKTLAIKLSGAKAINTGFKNALKIRDDLNKQEERSDRQMVEKYVLR
jgi:hypothetical protein